MKRSSQVALGLRERPDIPKPKRLRKRQPPQRFVEIEVGGPGGHSAVFYAKQVKHHLLNCRDYSISVSVRYVLPVTGPSTFTVMEGENLIHRSQPQYRYYTGLEFGGLTSVRRHFGDIVRIEEGKMNYFLSYEESLY